MIQAMEATEDTALIGIWIRSFGSLTLRRGARRRWSCGKGCRYSPVPAWAVRSCPGAGSAVGIFMPAQARRVLQCGAQWPGDAAPHRMAVSRNGLRSNTIRRGTSRAHRGGRFICRTRASDHGYDVV